MASFGLVFPGQGSQYPGMGQDLYGLDPGVRELFAVAEEVLGRDRRSLCFEGPQEALDQTVNTQLSVLMVDLASWRAFAGRVAAGHSLGEHAALHAAGAIDLRAVLALVQYRAVCHQEALPEGEGAMARPSSACRARPSRRSAGGSPSTAGSFPSPAKTPPDSSSSRAIGVLLGLIRRIDRRLRLLNVEDGESLDRTAAALAS